jgi:CheY-like chemotaxis protein
VSYTGRPGAHARVLIIDDNPDSADSLRLLLDLLGYDARAAYTGLEGVSAALEFAPDFVLCDIGLPGLNGYEVAAMLRHNPVTTRARLIAVSAYGSEEAQARSREAGFEHILVKPANLDVLLRLLSEGR